MNNLKLDLTIKRYLLAAMRDKLESYDISDIETMTNREVSDGVYALFKREYGFEVERVGINRALVGWLQGLALNIDFYNHDILNLAKQWGILHEDASEREEDRLLDRYWPLMAEKLGQLFDGYRVPRD